MSEDNRGFVEQERNNEQRDYAVKRVGMIRVQQLCKTHHKKRGNHTFQEVKECQG